MNRNRRDFIRALGAATAVGMAGLPLSAQGGIGSRGGDRRRVRRRHGGEVPAPVEHRARRDARGAQRGVHLLSAQQSHPGGHHHAGGSHAGLWRSRLEARCQRVARRGGRHRCGRADGHARERQVAALRSPDRVVGRGSGLFEHSRPARGKCAGARAARLEGGAADAGLAPPARSHAGRRRVRHDRAQGAVSLPARTVRARLPGRLVLQAQQAEIEGADPRRQRQGRFEGGVVQEGVGGTAIPASSSTCPTANWSTWTCRPSRRSFSSTRSRPTCST